MNDKLLKIAEKHFSPVEERGSLETRNNDSEDFFEVSVWSLKAALEEAYKLGVKEGEKHHENRANGCDKRNC